MIGVFARRIVGWRISISTKTQFVLDALEYAIWQRKTPDNRDLAHHLGRPSHCFQENRCPLLSWPHRVHHPRRSTGSILCQSEHTRYWRLIVEQIIPPVNKARFTRIRGICLLDDRSAARLPAVAPSELHSAAEAALWNATRSVSFGARQWSSGHGDLTSRLNSERLYRSGHTLNSFALRGNATLALFVDKQHPSGPEHNQCQNVMILN